MSESEALSTATSFWDSINGPNLEQNVRPTRGLATAILRKGGSSAYEKAVRALPLIHRPNTAS